VVIWYHENMKSLDVTFRNTTKQTSYGKAFFDKIVAKTLQATKLKARTVAVSITLVGDDKIKTLNKKYRKKNKPTDVLSFPMYEMLGLGFWVRGSKNKSSFRKAELNSYPPTSSPLPLKNAILDIGDIFISIPTAKRYARCDNMTLKHKLQFLAVHGILHLLGFDHERSKTDEKKMFWLQNSILDLLKR
jgi:rRNA maturation RNase YbeY